MSIAAIPAETQTAPIVHDQIQVIYEGVDKPTETAVSPDGRHVYLAGGPTDNIVVYQRNIESGILTPIGEVRGGTDEVQGLKYIVALAISPDGRNIYAVWQVGNALAVYDRDSSTGQLTFVEVLRERDNGIDGLENGQDIVVSPDGLHVYTAAAFYEDGVAVFSRDPGTGVLMFVEVLHDGVDGVDGLFGAATVAVSPDGENVYAGGILDVELAVFQRNAISGVLTQIQVVRNGQNGVEGLGGPRCVTVSGDGKHVYAAGQSNDTIAIFERNTETGILAFVGIVQDGVNGVDGLDFIFSVAVSPDGMSVYTASRDGDGITVFGRDSESGGLSFFEVLLDGEGGADGLQSARSVVVSPDSQHVYATGTDDDSLVAFRRDVESGMLTFLESRNGGLTGVDGLHGVLHAAISPDGRHLYAAAGNSESSVAFFDRDIGRGTLTFRALVRDGIDGVDGIRDARFVEVSHDGNQVFVAGRSEDAVAIFSRDTSSGILSFESVLRDGVDGVEGLEGVLAVAVSGDGTSLYVVGTDEDALAVFTRDVTSSAVSFVEVLREGVGAIEGLLVPYSVVVSPDGAHVYVASLGSSAITVFDRNTNTGTLSFVESVQNDVDEVTSLNRVSSVIISPGGENVYGLSSSEDAITVFDRDGSSGRLSFVEAIRNGENGVEGLDGIQQARLSRSGDLLYTAAWYDDSVSVFKRDLSTGKLKLLETIRGNDAGIEGLKNVLGIALAPDGSHAYSVGYQENALAVFHKRVVGSVSGFVREAGSENPIKCAVVMALSMGEELVITATADANGHYSIEDLPGGVYDMYVHAPGFERGMIESLAVNDDDAIMQHISLTPCENISIITGIVSELETGLALTNVKVSASADNDLLYETYTCANGAYEIPVPTGKGLSEILLEFSLSNYTSVSRTVQADSGVDVQENIHLTKQRIGFGAIHALVVLHPRASEAIPVPNASVAITGGNSFLAGYTDETGQISFEGLLDETYTIRASASGYVGSTDQRFLTDGVEIPSTLVLGPPGPDLDLDGLLNAVDIQLIINIVLGLDVQSNGDVNGDGKADAGDIQSTINSVLGL